MRCALAPSMARPFYCPRTDRHRHRSHRRHSITSVDEDSEQAPITRTVDERQLHRSWPLLQLVLGFGGEFLCHALQVGALLWGNKSATGLVDARTVAGFSLPPCGN